MKSKSFIPTETRNKRTAKLDRSGAREIVRLINNEDARAAAAVKKASASVAQAVQKTADVFAEGGKIIFAGAGTSGRLGVMEAAECPPTFSTPPGRIIGIMAGGRGSVFKAKEGAEDDCPQGAKDILKYVKEGDIVFGIAASGVTPYVKGVLAAAKKAGAYTNFITCNGGVPKNSADNIIFLDTGAESLQGSTRMKAATATKMTLNIITTGAMALNGKIYKNLMVDVKATNTKLRARALKLVCAITSAGEKEAGAALKNADYKVKTAVVMLQLGLNKNKADALLKKHGGRLKEILE